MKRWMTFGLLLISLVLFAVLFYSSQDRSRFSEFRVSPDEFQRIKGDRSRTDGSLLTEIRFNTCPLFYDELTSAWFYAASRDDPDTDPAIGYEGPAGKPKLAFSGEIRPDQTVPMLAYTDTEYREYQLVITTLPLIRIESDADDFPSPEKETEHNIRFTMIDNRSSAHPAVIRSEGSIHVRGHGSATYEKKAYRLSLYEKNGDKTRHENKTALLGLRPDGDWLLYPGYNDQEKIRNIFSSNLWLASCGSDNSFGIKNGNEYRYVELFLNRQYWGLYAIGYPIDTEQMRIFPNLRGEYNEFLFKQTKWGPQDGAVTAADDGLEIQSDVKQSEADYGYSVLKLYFDYLSAGAVNGLSHNDADNPVDIWLFLKLIQADDSISTWRKSVNNILYTIKSTEEGSKILYTPWDMDRSWGNTVDLSAHNTTGEYAVKADNDRYEMRFSPVSIMLSTGDPEIAGRIRARYDALRNGLWSDETIGTMLDGFEWDIFGSGAYLREMDRWPDGSYIDPVLGLSLFRAYVMERFHSMDAYIAGL
ncbi:MAG: CotH kinase family protein [Flexilinea sp.]|nr:CotH kinase family protein [Flexilinea sp.]